MYPASDALVSVVCAWYNRAEYIRDTIDSLLSQDFESYEVIVVNDGSTDERVRKVLDSYHHPKLKVIHQSNLGFVKTIRMAIDSAKGEYIAIQGAGDISFPGRIARQADFLSTHPDYGIVGCRRIDVVTGGKAHGYATVEGTPGDHSLDQFLKGRNPFSHGEVMFRRDTYQAVGGYRPFFKFAQDRDLWIRVTRHKRAFMLKDVLYERRTFTDDGVSASKEKLFLQHALSAFASQCHYDREENGHDYVDLYGEYGALFRRPSGVFARSLSSLALQSLYLENMSDANKYSVSSLYEKITPYSLFVALVIWLSTKSRLMATIARIPLSSYRGARKWASRK